MSWPVEALGEHVEILSGYAFKSERFNTERNGLPLVRIRDVVRGRSETFFDGDFDSQFVVEDGDALIGMDGEFNIAKWKGGRALLNQRVCKISPKGRKLDSEYLLRYLPKALKDIEGKTPFVTVKHLSGKDIRNIEIPLPPLDEQRRIAAILDQADALRLKRQEAMRQLEVLSRVIFHDCFGDPKTNNRGWPTSALGKLAEFYSGNTLPAGSPFSGEIGGYLILKVSDLNHSKNTKDITESAIWSSKAGSRAATCPKGSIVFPKRGGAIATNKKRILRRNAVLDPNLMGVSPDTKIILPDFLFGWFQTFNLSEIASGSSVPQLNKQDLDPLKIIVPTLAAQLDYAQKIENLSEADLKMQVFLSDANNLFASLQHRAFRGEL
jgi:type I restriction enzyme, S subunit